MERRLRRLRHGRLTLRAGRALQIAGLAAGSAGLALQFAITIPASMAVGRSLAGSVVFYFSFFTILTNLAVVLVHAARLSGARSGLAGCLASPRIAAGVCVSIVMVAIVYAVVLAQLWSPRGWFLVADVVLHYVTPALFLAWWLLDGADGSTRWSDIMRWMTYPLAYFAYAMARAPVAGEVPYPFLDLSTNGWAGVLTAAASMTALFVVLSAVAIAADHAIASRRIPHGKDARPR